MKRDMGAFNILGICDGHDASASLLVDGKIVHAVSEERFTRRKKTCGYPSHAVESCLQAAGLSVDKLTLVVLAGKYIHPLWDAIRREEYFDVPAYVREQQLFDAVLPPRDENELQDALEKYVKIIAREDKREDLARALQNWEGAGFGDAMVQFADERRQRIASHLNYDMDHILLADHHRCHAAYAFFSSPLRSSDTLVLTMDGAGDGANATISLGSDKGPGEVFRTGSCQLGRLYSAVTLRMGLKPEEHEYKVMGLAPYADAHECQRAQKQLSPLFQEINGLDFEYPEKAIPKENIYLELGPLLEGLRFDGVAAAIQQYVEDMIKRWVETALARFECKNIVFSGGMANNVKVNNLLACLPGVEQFQVSPGPGDESLAIGAAYLGGNEIRCQLGLPLAFLQSLENAYLGPVARETDVHKAIKILTARGFRVQPASAPLIAAELASGRIIGRFQGQMEFGPRALGNRSILADPNNPAMAGILNRRVKKRDFWMPFAPIVLSSRYQNHFELPPAASGQFMTVACDTTSLCQQEAPAAIHPYDYSARPQVLDAATNPELADILTAFQAQTNRSVLLNTSLNVHGNPIINHPYDAAVMLCNGNLDGLILEDMYIKK